MGGSNSAQEVSESSEYEEDRPRQRTNNRPRRCNFNRDHRSCNDQVPQGYHYVQTTAHRGWSSHPPAQYHSVPEHYQKPTNNRPRQNQRTQSASQPSVPAQCAVQAVRPQAVHNQKSKSNRPRQNPPEPVSAGRIKGHVPAARQSPIPEQCPVQPVLPQPVFLGHGGSLLPTPNVTSVEFPNRQGTTQQVPKGGAQLKVKSMTKDQLAVIAGRSHREILFQIQTISSGFMNLLHTDYTDDVLVLVVDVLAKVCGIDDCPHTVNALLQTAMYTKLFNDRVVRYLQTPHHDSTDMRIFLENLLVIFTTLLREFKAEAEGKLGKCLIVGKQAITQQIDPSDLEDELLRKMRCLVTVRKPNDEGITADAVSAKEYPTVFGVDYDPPSYSKPQSSKDYKLGLLNSVRKAFVDTFRIGSEDAKYPRQNFYTNVLVIGTDVTHDDGVLYNLSFEAEDCNVPWNCSTKLLEGSTVLLAPSLQDELHCAVVAMRCPQDLARGQLWVKLVNQKSTVLKGTAPLVMVENFTYEADFVSLMAALSAQLEHPLPFAKLILGMEKKVAHPIYLDSGSEMQFPFFKKGFKADEVQQYKVLSPASWPPAHRLGHDDRLHDAYKHALTTTLALVHCPSRTDSITFGVHVLLTFLHSEALWPQFKAPVVLLSRTEDALDNVLSKAVAALPQEKVVRIGGVCKDTALMGYSLDEARVIVCSTNAAPSYVVQNQRYLLEKMRKMKAEIDAKMEYLEKSRVSILKSSSLKPHIAERNGQQLMKLSGQGDSDPMVKFLSTYAHIVFRLSENSQNVGFGREQSGETGAALEESLDQIEMARRISSSLSSHFRAMDKDWRQKTGAPPADNPFVKQRELDGTLVNQMGGKQFNLAEIARAELKREKREDVMDPSVVNEIRQLGAQDRWRLYRYWLSMWYSCTKEELAKLLTKYEKSFLQLQEAVRETDVSILQRAKVVGVTTAAAAVHHRLLKMLAPRVIIVQEAGQIAEASLIAALTEHCCHLIMIGDHQRLKPTLNGFRSSDSSNPPRTISLFENLIEKGIVPVEIPQQRQMSSALQNVLNSLFSSSVSRILTAQDHSSNVRGMASDFFFINSNSSESVPKSSPDSYTNEFEASYLVLLSKYLVGRGHAPSQITILASCVGQVHLLKQLCIKSDLGLIECTTMEGYQGSRNAIILMSMVRSNDRGDVGPMANGGIKAHLVLAEGISKWCY